VKHFLGPGAPAGIRDASHATFVIACRWGTGGPPPGFSTHTQRTVGRPVLRGALEEVTLVSGAGRWAPPLQNITTPLRPSDDGIFLVKRTTNLLLAGGDRHTAVRAATCEELADRGRFDREVEGGRDTLTDQQCVTESGFRNRGAEGERWEPEPLFPARGATPNHVSPAGGLPAGQVELVFQRPQDDSEGFPDWPSLTRHPNVPPAHPPRGGPGAGSNLFSPVGRPLTHGGRRSPSTHGSPWRLQNGGPSTKRFT